MNFNKSVTNYYYYGVTLQNLSIDCSSLPILLLTFADNFSSLTFMAAVSPWRTFKRRFKKILICVSILIVLVFLLVSAFSYTKFSTFYYILKKRFYLKLHHNFGI